MSVINQVLSDLEKRGASSLSGEADIRVVPMRTNRHVLWLIVAVSALVVVWAGLWKSAPPQPETLPKPLPLTVPDMVVMPADEPVARVEQKEDRTTGVKPALPAMRLSYELSAMPLTTETRQRPSQKMLTENHIKSPAVAVEKSGSAEKQMKQFSTQQRADNEFRRATGLVQKGRSNEALEAYGAALKLDAAHDGARQAMVWILLENKRNADAERILQEGLKINLRNSEFAMLLARLQVERSDLPLAMDTLQKTLPYVGKQAEYHAFVAAVYQRMSRHNETIEHYQIAVQQTPNAGIWLMGLGISLHALQRNEEARAAFKRAIETHTLSAELQAFVEQRLKEL